MQMVPPQKEYSQIKKVPKCSYIILVHLHTFTTLQFKVA